MSGTASRRINELHQELLAQAGLAFDPVASSLELKAIKQYLDELADGIPVPHPIGTDSPEKE